MQGLLARLDEFVVPFAALLEEPEQRRHTGEYLTGLLSKLKHKTSEGIAYLLDQERQGLQKFVGHVPWDHQPLLGLLAQQVGAELGEPDGVLVFDPSGKQQAAWRLPSFVGASRPVGITVDGQGRVYISDGLTSQVVRVPLAALLATPPATP